MRLKGLEPPRREASDPKSDVATNYTTAALLRAKVNKFRQYASAGGEILVFHHSIPTHAQSQLAVGESF